LQQQWRREKLFYDANSRDVRPPPHVGDRFEQVKLSTAAFPLQQKRQRSYTKMQQGSFIAALNYRTIVTSTKSCTKVSRNPFLATLKVRKAIGVSIYCI
jgi:hypothetical protein